MDTQQDILADELIFTQSRRSLLPLWIKIFIWIFMILGVLVPLGYIFSLSGAGFNVAIYGYESSDPLSWQAILISATMLGNGIVAYLLYTQHRNAVAIALPVAYFNIALCVISMVLTMAQGSISLRLELIPLFFYIIKLKGIEYDWETGAPNAQLN